MQTDTRYAAHMPLTGIGATGQQRIGNARVVIIGLGGLGCAAAQYLVSSGVGQLTLCDFDTVTASNLSRQILYTEADVGAAKVEAARRVLDRLNPHTTLSTVDQRADDANMAGLLEGTDLVIDASDNYGTRLMVNRNCRSLGIPWVMGACIRMEGQITLLRPDTPGQPCYRCIYGKAPDTLEDCPGAGVFAPVAGIVGSSMACFALQHLAGLQVPGGIHLLDAHDWSWRSVRVARLPDCPACGSER